MIPAAYFLIELLQHEHFIRLLVVGCMGKWGKAVRELPFFINLVRMFAWADSRDQSLY